jgi:hypothetical protein
MIPTYYTQHLKITPHLIDQSLATLQAHPNGYEKGNKTFRQPLLKELPEFFSPLDHLEGLDYRFAATETLGRIVLANRKESPRWHDILTDDPDYRFLRDYPVIWPYHKYCNDSMYREWEEAPIEKGFTSYFITAYD